MQNNPFSNENTLQQKSVPLALIRGLRHLTPNPSPSAVIIGNFDGVHLGHQALIACLKHTAKQHQLSPILILFEPQTNEFLLKNQAPARLMRLREKIKVLHAMGVNRILVLPFTQKLASLSANYFIQEILIERLNVRHLIAGDDFRFGQGRQGTLDLIKAQGIEVLNPETVYVGTKRVSSTAIRNFLEKGELASAASYLGRLFSMSGYVRRGDQRARTIGFPTANLCLHRKKVPISGVYVVKVDGIGGKRLNGVANVGTRPTFEGTKTLLEVHLFDFKESIYDHYIDVQFIHKLREEKKYDSFDELKAQIAKDVEQAKRFFLQKNHGDVYFNPH